MLLRDLEDVLHLGNVFRAWVIYNIGPEHLHFFLCYKTALIAEALLCEILAATVANRLLVEPALLFLPIATYLGIPGVINVRVDAGRPAAGDAHALRVGVRYVHVCIAVRDRNQVNIVYSG